MRNLEGPGLLRFRFGSFEVKAPLLLHGVGETISDVPVALGGKTSPGIFQADPLLRVGLQVSVKDLLFSGFRLVGEHEHDMHLNASFPLQNADDNSTIPLAGEGLPNQNHLELYDLRKALLRVHVGRAFFASAGVMSPHWGLGLVSNDGAHTWSPQSALFTHPHHGDRVLRTMVGTGPWTDIGLSGSFFADLVLDDDALLLAREYSDPDTAENDFAWQAGGALFFGRGQRFGAGLYGALRSQTTSDGRALIGGIGDVTAHYEQRFFDFVDVKVEGEFALIAGSTNFSPNLNYEDQLVLQYGGVLRAGAAMGLFGAVVDFVYASGDQNYDDNMQNALRIDQSFDMGMLLYKQVLASQTGHAVVTAGDPNLVGAAATGLGDWC
ncbi:MAG: hypothetical protein GY822_27860 [Deltaproteobacteria bacterium]|nr:hypothetical protein [Deltaproteobacteria bacterium]